MKSVGLKVLKNRLSEYVRIAAQGETVLVTDRDRVVAEIRPPESGRSEFVADALFADAIRNGLIRPPVIRCDTPPAGNPVMKLSDLLDQLSKDRDER